MKPLNTQSGNVLFLILIAVALFAALSYAVTRSSRGGGDADREIASIQTAKLLYYATQLTATVQRLKIINSCTDFNLSFESPAWSNPLNYNHSNEAPNNACNIFHKSGGGVSWQDPVSGSVPGVIEPLITGSLMVHGLGSDGSDPHPLASNFTELTFMSRVTRDVCLEINSKAGITNTGGEPPQFQYGSFIPNGTPLNWASFGWNDANLYGVGNNIGTIYSPCGCELFAKPTGCYQTTADDQGYYFYHAIIER